MSSSVPEPNSRQTQSPELPAWKAPPITQETLEWADILTVDLSKFEESRQELVEVVEQALSRDGFFYVVNHGIDPVQLNRQFALGDLVLNGVSREEKEAYKAPIKEKGSFRGYKLQSYWEIKNGIRDRIEHYNFYQNSIDPTTSHPEPVRPYINEVKSFLEESRSKVLKRVASLIDGVLGLEDDHIWRLHETKEGLKGDDLLRYMIYDPLTAEESSQTNGVMLNGHTDFNSISILISQPITALQVLMPDNVWRFVKHKENALVINIGDQLSFMSGGILKGTMHRVVRPPKDQEHLRRLGVFHFAHFIDKIPLDLFPSEKVQRDGRQIFDGPSPTMDEWERNRIKSYGTSDFIKGEEYDIEILNGLQIRHYH